MKEDPPRIHDAMKEIAAHLPIDTRNIALGGFSDGASYALTFGTQNSALFRTILAFSPGMAFLPRRSDPAQRIFVAHGRRDSVLPYRNTSAGIVPLLRKAGLDPTFRTFDGDHVIAEDVMREAFLFWRRPPD
jgi:predicted esterase